MENTSPEMVSVKPQLSIFSPELKDKLTESIGDEHTNYAEAVIAKHIIISAKELGLTLGKAIARKILGAEHVQ